MPSLRGPRVQPFEHNLVTCVLRVAHVQPAQTSRATPFRDLIMENEVDGLDDAPLPLHENFRAIVLRVIRIAFDLDASVPFAL